LAIVDAVTAMEGDGPLMGKPRHVGCLAMGADVVATDATCAGIMGLNPEKIPCRPLTSWSNSAKCVSRLTGLVVAV
jgi:uncharacterized protein (DUF362 family)